MNFSCFQVVCVHAALFLHHLHICSLAACTLSIKIVFLLTTQYQSSSLTIPLLLTSATLAGLLVIGWLHYKQDNYSCNLSENEMLLRAMKKSAKSKRKSD